MKNNQQFRQWYSAKGAKQGGVLALFFAALWLCWAIGYTQAWKQIEGENALPLTIVTSDKPVVHGANDTVKGEAKTLATM